MANSTLLLNQTIIFIENLNKTIDVTHVSINSPPLIKKIHDILITTLLLAVMFAMGCSITLDEVWSHIRKPIGVLAGMASQFILLPFSGYCLIVLLKIEPLHAAGLLILASSPGGVTSNLFTIFCEGDISLSVTMTTFSTVVALIMMPFNLWIYGSSLETDTIVIPYNKMFLSLFLLTTPVAFGMLVYWKYPKVAPILSKIGSVSGFAIIIVCQTLEILIFPNIFEEIPVSIMIAEILLPFSGFLLGYCLSSIFKLPYAIRRTISIESGVQNVGTALAIVSLSYPFSQLRKVWLFPFLYAFSMLGVCILMSIFYQLHKRYSSSKKFNISSEDFHNSKQNIVTVEFVRYPV